MKSKASFENSNVLIIGGTGDIGWAIAEEFARLKSNIFVVGRSASESEQRLGASLGSDAKGHVRFFNCDLSAPENIENLAAKIRAKCASIDILIFASAIQHRSTINDLESDKLRSILGVNLESAFVVAKEFFGLLKLSKAPRVIFITSLSAYFGIPGISAYASSKSALQQLARSLAVEWAQFGITVNSIAPGRIKTRMTQDLVNNEDSYASSLRVIPMARWGTPADLLSAVRFFAAPDSSYVTGQTICIDGGWSASGGNING